MAGDPRMESLMQRAGRLAEEMGLASDEMDGTEGADSTDMREALMEAVNSARLAAARQPPEPQPLTAAKPPLVAHMDKMAIRHQRAQQRLVADERYCSNLEHMTDMLRLNSLRNLTDVHKRMSSGRLRASEDHQDCVETFPPGTLGGAGGGYGDQTFGTVSSAISVDVDAPQRGGGTGAASVAASPGNGTGSARQSTPGAGGMAADALRSPPAAITLDGVVDPPPRVSDNALANKVKNLERQNENLKAQLERQSKDIESSLFRVSKIAEKIKWVRDEAKPLEEMYRKQLLVDVDELYNDIAFFQREREYLYSKVFGCDLENKQREEQQQQQEKQEKKKDGKDERHAAEKRQLLKQNQLATRQVLRLKRQIAEMKNANRRDECEKMHQCDFDCAGPEKQARLKAKRLQQRGLFKKGTGGGAGGKSALDARRSSSVSAASNFADSDEDVGGPSSRAGPGAGSRGGGGGPRAQLSTKGSFREIGKGTGQWASFPENLEQPDFLRALTGLRPQGLDTAIHGIVTDCVAAIAGVMGNFDKHIELLKNASMDQVQSLLIKCNNASVEERRNLDKKLKRHAANLRESLARPVKDAETSTVEQGDFIVQYNLKDMGFAKKNSDGGRYTRRELKGIGVSADQRCPLCMHLVHKDYETDEDSVDGSHKPAAPPVGLRLRHPNDKKKIDDEKKALVSKEREKVEQALKAKHDLEIQKLKDKIARMQDNKDKATAKAEAKEKKDTEKKAVQAEKEAKQKEKEEKKAAAEAEAAAKVAADRAGKMENEAKQVRHMQDKVEAKQKTLESNAITLHHTIFRFIRKLGEDLLISEALIPRSKTDVDKRRLEAKEKALEKETATNQGAKRGELQNDRYDYVLKMMKEDEEALKKYWDFITAANANALGRLRANLKEEQQRHEHNAMVLEAMRDAQKQARAMDSTAVLKSLKKLHTPSLHPAQPGGGGTDGVLTPPAGTPATAAGVGQGPTMATATTSPRGSPHLGADAGVQFGTHQSMSSIRSLPSHRPQVEAGVGDGHVLGPPVTGSGVATATADLEGITKVESEHLLSPAPLEDSLRVSSAISPQSSFRLMRRTGGGGSPRDPPPVATATAVVQTGDELLAAAVLDERFKMKMAELDTHDAEFEALMAKEKEETRRRQRELAATRKEVAEKEKEAVAEREELQPIALAAAQREKAVAEGERDSLKRQVKSLEARRADLETRLKNAQGEKDAIAEKLLKLQRDTMAVTGKKGNGANGGGPRRTGGAIAAVAALNRVARGDGYHSNSGSAVPLSEGWTNTGPVDIVDDGEGAGEAAAIAGTTPIPMAAGGGGGSGGASPRPVPAARRAGKNGAGGDVSGLTAQSLSRMQTMYSDGGSDYTGGDTPGRGEGTSPTSAGGSGMLEYSPAARVKQPTPMSQLLTTAGGVPRRTVSQGGRRGHHAGTDAPSPRATAAVGTLTDPPSTGGSRTNSPQAVELHAGEAAMTVPVGGVDGRALAPGTAPAAIASTRNAGGGGGGGLPIAAANNTTIGKEAQEGLGLAGVSVKASGGGGGGGGAKAGNSRRQPQSGRGGRAANGNKDGGKRPTSPTTAGMELVDDVGDALDIAVVESRESLADGHSASLEGSPLAADDGAGPHGRSAYDGRVPATGPKEFINRREKVMDAAAHGLMSNDMQPVEIAADASPDDVFDLPEGLDSPLSDATSADGASRGFANAGAGAAGKGRVPAQQLQQQQPLTHGQSAVENACVLRVGPLAVANASTGARKTAGSKPPTASHVLRGRAASSAQMSAQRQMQTTPAGVALDDVPPARTYSTGALLLGGNTAPRPQTQQQHATVPATPQTMPAPGTPLDSGIVGLFPPSGDRARPGTQDGTGLERLRTITQAIMATNRVVRGEGVEGLRVATQRGWDGPSLLEQMLWDQERAALRITLVEGNVRADLKAMFLQGVARAQAAADRKREVELLNQIAQAKAASEAATRQARVAVETERETALQALALEREKMEAELESRKLEMARKERAAAEALKKEQEKHRAMMEQEKRLADQQHRAQIEKDEQEMKKKQIELKKTQYQGRALDQQRKQQLELEERRMNHARDSKMTALHQRDVEVQRERTRLEAERKELDIKAEMQRKEFNDQVARLDRERESMMKERKRQGRDLQAQQIEIEHKRKEQAAEAETLDFRKAEIEQLTKHLEAQRERLENDKRQLQKSRNELLGYQREVQDYLRRKQQDDLEERLMGGEVMTFVAAQGGPRARSGDAAAGIVASYAAPGSPNGRRLSNAVPLPRPLSSGRNGTPPKLKRAHLRGDVQFPSLTPSGHPSPRTTSPRDPFAVPVSLQQPFNPPPPKTPKINERLYKEPKKDAHVVRQLKEELNFKTQRIYSNADDIRDRKKQPLQLAMEKVGLL